jgi:hypothetical protein
MDYTTIDAVIFYTSIALAVASQGAAIFGKPALVAKVAPLSKFFDVIAGNYRKARNEGPKAVS